MPIAAGTSIRASVHNTLAADATLLAMLPNGASSILPRDRLDPAKVAKPFVFVRLEGVGGSDDAMQIGTWACEVHDRPGYGLAEVDRIIQRIKFLFHHQNWPTPSGSTERPRKSTKAGETGELADQDWSTMKRIVRFQIVQS